MSRRRFYDSHNTWHRDVLIKEDGGKTRKVHKKVHKNTNFMQVLRNFVSDSETLLYHCKDNYDLISKDFKG